MILQLNPLRRWSHLLIRHQSLLWRKIANVTKLKRFGLNAQEGACFRRPSFMVHFPQVTTDKSRWRKEQFGLGKKQKKER